MKPSKSRLKPPSSIDQSTKSNPSQDLFPLPLPSLLSRRIHHLYTTYDDCSSASNLKYTDSILKNSPKPSTILFKDSKDYDLKKENLQELYQGQQIDIKFEEVIGYYVFYEDIPRLFMVGLAHVVNKRIEHQRVLRYKTLKHTLGIGDEELRESAREVVGESMEGSKCLPTGILEDQTENSIRSIVKRLSILMGEQQEKMQKHALTEGCLTLMRTNKKPLHAHKLNTIQHPYPNPPPKSKQKLTSTKLTKPHKQNRKTSMGNQKSAPKKRPISGVKDLKNTTRCSSSKRKQSGKSVEDMVRKHGRQMTRSPEGFEKTLKKKHIRMFSSQQEEIKGGGGKNGGKGGLGKSAYEPGGYLEINKSKNKLGATTFIKKKTRYEI